MARIGFIGGALSIGADCLAFNSEGDCMTKFYVVARATQWYVTEIDADSKEQAAEMAYERDQWKQAYLSDDLEFAETLAEGDEACYLDIEDLKRYL